MKKTILLIIICISCTFCSSQMKLNKSKEVDILLKLPTTLTVEVPTMYSLKNNTNNIYIIDPYGFIGDSYWVLNNEKLNPIAFSKGYYSRDNDDCKTDLIILKPKQKMDTILILNYMERGIYDFSKSGNYIWNVKSRHIKQNGMTSSCKQYISDLEDKGYILLDDSIEAKIPFVKR